MLNGDTVELTFVFFHGKYFRSHCCFHIMLDKCKHCHCMPHTDPKEGELPRIAQTTARREAVLMLARHMGEAPLLFFFLFWKTGIMSIHHNLRKDLDRWESNRKWRKCKPHHLHERF